jgi:hypothetical protein
MHDNEAVSCHRVQGFPSSGHRVSGEKLDWNAPLGPRCLDLTLADQCPGVHGVLEICSFFPRAIDMFMSRRITE